MRNPLAKLEAAFQEYILRTARTVHTFEHRLPTNQSATIRLYEYSDHLRFELITVADPITYTPSENMIYANEVAIFLRLAEKHYYKPILSSTNMLLFMKNKEHHAHPTALFTHPVADTIFTNGFQMTQAFGRASVKIYELSAWTPPPIRRDAENPRYAFETYCTGLNIYYKESKTNAPE